MSAKAIIFLTTVKRSLYRRDLLNACCAPAGTYLQLAYRQDPWVESSLIGVGLGSVPAWIVYMEELVDSKLILYHPVRRTVIVDVDDELGGTVAGSGRSSTYTLYLQDFVDYTRKPDFFDKFQEFVAQTDRRDPAALEATPPNLVRGTESILAISYTLSCLPLWEHLRHLGSFRDCCFFMVTKSDRPLGEPSELFPLPGKLFGHPIYTMKAGSSAQVMLYVRFGPDADQTFPKLDVASDIATASGPFIQQRSAGLQVSYVLQFERPMEKKTALLTLRAPTDKAGDHISPEVAALLQVELRRIHLWGPLAMITLGVFLVGFDASLAEELIGTDFNWPVAAAIAKLLGTLLVGSGMYWRFRELPGLT